MPLTISLFRSETANRGNEQAGSIMDALPAFAHLWLFASAVSELRTAFEHRAISDDYGSQSNCLRGYVSFTLQNS